MKLGDGKRWNGGGDLYQFVTLDGALGIGGLKGPDRRDHRTRSST